MARLNMKQANAILKLYGLKLHKKHGDWYTSKLEHEGVVMYTHVNRYFREDSKTIAKVTEAIISKLSVFTGEIL